MKQQDVKFGAGLFHCETSLQMRLVFITESELNAAGLAGDTVEQEAHRRAGLWSSSVGGDTCRFLIGPHGVQPV